MQSILICVLAAAVGASPLPEPVFEPVHVGPHVGHGGKGARDAAAAGVLSLPLAKTHVADGPLARRGGGDVPEPVQNYRNWLYLGSVGFGTPAQSFQQVIDTGSADLWTYSSLQTSGGFSTNQSSTYELVGAGNFSINYVKGSARGDLAADTVTIAGASIARQQFGVANNASQLSQWGTLGVGYASNEAVAARGGAAYPNVPESLKNSGSIARNLYSLYLNSVYSTAGEILFGGIDTAKYEGKLHKAEFTSKQVFSVAAQINGQQMEGILDSGTSALAIPTAAYDPAFKAIQGWVPALQHQADGDIYYVTDLGDVPADKNLTVTIAGTDFPVPITNLFEQTGVMDDNWYLLFFDTTKKSDGRVWLGDAFLRAAYVVFDLDGGAAALAPARYTNDTNVVAVGADGIPAELLA